MKTFPWKEFLQTHPIFGTLRDDKRIDALLKDDVSSERFCAKDEVIVRQGEVGDSVFLIGAGAAEATLELGEGQPIPLSVMRKGDLFGEMALLDDEKRSATVVAKEACTVLEIRGREFEQLMAEYPEIESRLLVTISRRLRNTGEQILGLHLTNVDEKLRLFNLKLDTEQRLVEASLRAAQVMFDQTKLRTDEVITSAELSRDRLNKSVGLVSAFATVILLILGAFGFKQVWDVRQMARDAAADAKTSKDNVEASNKAIAQIEGNRAKVVNAVTEVNELMTAVKDIKAPLVDIVRGHFVDNVQHGKMPDAKRDYLKLISLGGPGELETAVDTLEPELLSDYPPKLSPNPNPSILALLDDLAKDSANATDKSTPVKIYRLQIGYSILTDQNKPARARLYTTLAGYLESHPTAKLQPSGIFSSLLEKVQRQDADKAAELKALRDLTTRP